MRGPVYTLALLLALFETALADKAAYMELQGENLVRGRAIWLESCEGCHGYGVAGAPIPMNPQEWAPRLEKGKQTLYQHAIGGFFGPDDTMMPERGGNPDLSDAEVMAAVDYMTALAAYYIQRERK